MTDLESLRLAEDFFAADEEMLALARALILGALERWPDTAVVIWRGRRMVSIVFAPTSWHLPLVFCVMRRMRLL